jgi:hypothetical protein
MNNDSPPAEMTRLGRLPGLAADLLIGLLGIWAVYSQVLSATSRNFDFLLSTIWLVPALFLVFALWLLFSNDTTQSNAASNETPKPGTLLGPQWITLALLLGLIATGYLLASRWLLWFGCAGYFAGLIYFAKQASTTAIALRPADLHASNRDLIALLIVILIGVAVTITFSRANADDGYYLNAIVSTLDHSELPLLHFDGLHDDLSRPNHLITQKRQTFEVLIATVAAVTGLTTWAVYYVWSPIFFAIFIGVANWLILKRIAGDHAWQALLATLLTLLVWDGGGRTFGVWSFTMLYPGKVVMLALLIPLIVHYTFELIARQNLRTWILLALAQTAALSFSSSGIYAGALASGLVLLASLSIDKTDFKRILLIGLALLPNLAMLIINWLEIQSTGGLGSEGIAYGPTALFGQNIRGATAFLLLLLLPLLAYLTGSKWAAWLTRYLALSILILFNPLVVDLLGVLAKLLTWRSVWAIPVPALIGFSIVLVNAYRTQSASGTAYQPTYLLPLVAAGLIGLFVFSSQPTIAGGGVFIKPGQAKIDSLQLRIASHIHEVTAEDDLALVPYRVSGVLAGLHKAPNQVAVRPIYIDHMGISLTPEDAAARKEMQRFVTMGSDDPTAWRRVMDEIVSRGVDVVVVVHQPDKPTIEFENALESAGYSRTTFEIVDIWKN